ncbi:MAG: PEGA domain-containing protein [Patescibacteria group bacterium]
MKAKNKKTAGFGIKAMIIILGIILLVVVSLYAFGIRVGTFGITKATEVNILDLPEESEIFLDNQSVGIRKGNISLKLAPGFHSILISKFGFWPYLENVEIKDKNTTTIRPFFVLQNPSGVMIGNQTKEYKEIAPLFDIPNDPDKELVSKNEVVTISYEDGQIFAKWLADKNDAPEYLCDKETEKCQKTAVFKPTTKLRNMSFFKDRDDVLIIAIEKGIFALELNPQGTQNLQPIFEGKSPEFRIKDGFLYAKDEGSLILISI